MKIISIGHKMPKWVAEGFATYQKRLIKPWQLDLLELPARETKAQEALLILAKVQSQDFCVVLDVLGQGLTTPALAKKMETWQGLGKEIIFIIGGADGLDETILQRADFTWSLSQLTFPHQLVKIMLAEQLYRAVSILQNHPYHRS